MNDASYEERLVAPLAWWLTGLAFVVIVWWIFLVATPLWLAWTAALVALVLVVGLLGHYSSAQVAVAEGELRAGRAHIPLALCGVVEPLDRDQTRDAGGAGADARAFLVLRPYISTAVRVAIDDPQDPVPYWLLSSRHPARLAAAVRAGRPVAE